MCNDFNSKHIKPFAFFAPSREKKNLRTLCVKNN